MFAKILSLTVLAMALLGSTAATAQTLEHAVLTVQDRQVEVTIWPAEGKTLAVIVFSHGAGGEPRAYERLIQVWTSAGFLVLAPLHVDSHAYPEPGKYDLRQAFMLRIADLAAVRDLARERAPGLPLVAAGHSYGSLMASIAGGAVTAVGSCRDADVDAVILLSSAGVIPGLVRPDTFAGLAVPSFTVTGDADLVERYAADWHVHRAAFDAASGTGHVLLIFEAGGHAFVRDADEEDFGHFARASVDFILARALDDGDAAARLDALAAPGLTVERR